MIKLFRRLFLDQWKAIDEEARAEREAEGRTGFDWRPVVILIVVAVSLTLQEYYGQRPYFAQKWPRDLSDKYWDLKSFAWWTGFRFAGYVVLPVLVILCMPGERLRDYFISFKDFFKKLKIYVGLFLLILPVVLYASTTRSFKHTYPFYRLANRSTFDLLAWEGMYALQFLSLEFFFRGFMLKGMRSALGAQAIFVMIVPYCMIHYGKPLPETLGAIFAGIILGTLAMRTRSIWGGVLIHIGVAMTMDMMALGSLPKRP